jgi:hypothetical protein
MRVFVISLCHMEPTIIAYSLTQAIMTMGMDCRNPHWVLVDHHWPKEKEATSEVLERLSDLVLGEVISPEKNLGGHGGYNFAVQYLIDQYELQDDDLVLSYDPDSNPLTHGWLTALIKVMKSDLSLDYLSLMPEKIKNNRAWVIEEIAGHRVAKDSQPEMINVTLWRAKCIKQKVTSVCQYYGNIESHMWSRGFKNAYLIDFKEEDNPIPHYPLYTEWKLKHSTHQYAGNFDQYFQEHHDNDNR